MLPVYLKHLRDTLQSKGLNSRSPHEDAVLEELNRIDRLLNVPSVAKEAESRDITESQVSVRGILVTQGKCACCGK